MSDLWLVTIILLAHPNTHSHISHSYIALLSMVSVTTCSEVHVETEPRHQSNALGADTEYWEERERGSRLAAIMVFFMEPEFKQWFSSKTEAMSHLQPHSINIINVQCEPHTRTIKGKQRTSFDGHWADHLCPAWRMFNVHYENFNWTIVVIISESQLRQCCDNAMYDQSVSQCLPWIISYCWSAPTKPWCHWMWLVTGHQVITVVIRMCMHWLVQSILVWLEINETLSLPLTIQVCDILLSSYHLIWLMPPISHHTPSKLGHLAPNTSAHITFYHKLKFNGRDPNSSFYILYWTHI